MDDTHAADKKPSLTLLMQVPFKLSSAFKRYATVSMGLTLLIGLAGLHFFWLAFSWINSFKQPYVADALYNMPTLLSALLILMVSARQRGKARRGWLLVGLGIAAQAAGNLTWTYLEFIAKVTPFPSLADLFYLLFAPLLAASLFYLLPAPHTRLKCLKLGLDLAITVGAIGLFFGVFF